MKAVYFLIILTILPLTYASIETLKSSYSPQETLQAIINLDGTSTKYLLASDVELKINSTKISVAPILIKLEDSKYFLYFQLPNEAGYYELSVKSIQEINDILTEKKDNVTIDVRESNYSLKIDPALIRLDASKSNPYFKVYLTNKGNEDLNLNINTESDFIKASKNYVTIPPKETRTVYILTDTSKELNDTIISLDDYLIPIYIYNQKESLIEIENITEEDITEETEPAEIPEEDITEAPIEFLTKTEYLDLILKQEKTLNGIIPIRNKFSREIKDIKIELTSDLPEIAELNITSIDILKAKENYNIPIIINKEKTGSGSYFGSLLIKTESSEIELPISVVIEKAKEEYEEITSEEPESENVDFGSDDYQMPFSFEEKKEEIPKEKPSNKGLLLFIPVLALIIFFALKMLKKRPKKRNFSEYLKEK